MIDSEKIQIIGGQIPKGSLKVSGAKNSATRLLAASLLTDEEILLTNFPTELVDVRVKTDFLRAIGADVTLDCTGHFAHVCAKNVRCSQLVSYDYPIRTTYLLVAGQLFRSGRALIPYPGGCKIGNRKSSNRKCYP